MFEHNGDCDLDECNRLDYLKQKNKLNNTDNSNVYIKGNKTIYTAGRPSWYNSSGQINEPLVIGLSGGSGSGKTTVAKKIIEALNVQWVSLLSMDSFYKVLTDAQHELALKNEYNFDHPNAFDFELIIETLRELKHGKCVNVPIYNFATHSREKQVKTVYGANVIIFEGIMAFVDKNLLESIDLKIFVDTDSDIRLARRLKRDIVDRGRSIHSVIEQYNKYVKPAFDFYIAPSMKYADIIVPNENENEIAIDLIMKYVNRELHKRGCNLRSDLAFKSNYVKGQPFPSSLFKMKETPQLKYLLTLIRDKETSSDDFVFYSNRLMRLLIEYALSLLPFDDVVVQTADSCSYAGKRHSNALVCGVSILRAGQTMELALSEVYKDAKIGKILIQTNEYSGEPELHFLALPTDIKNSKVLLLDATLATGAAATMAIRILLDHHVEEQNILLVALVTSEQGIHNVAYAFPHVKIVTSAVDPELDHNGYILPGVGNFGDRYYGT